MPTQKYFIASDLHLEFKQGYERKFWEEFPDTQGAKVCICAGDLTTFGLPDAIAFSHFNELCKRFDKVIYVPGNHEYYGSNPTSVEQRIRSFESILRPVLTVLRAGESYVHEGQRFIGDTMWFVDKPEVHIYRRTVNDSYQIRDFFPWVFTQSSLFMNFLSKEVREEDIVITHHIPNDVDTAPMWRTSPTQSYFLNDSCNRYYQNPNTVKPKAWVFGHTHDYHLYKVDRTQFICNPVGYASENTSWKERVIYQI